MEIHFDKEYLQQLYEEGKTKDKKYRFQPQMVKRYQLRKGNVYLQYSTIKVDICWLPG